MSNKRKQTNDKDKIEQKKKVTSSKFMSYAHIKSVRVSRKKLSETKIQTEISTLKS